MPQCVRNEVQSAPSLSTRDPFLLVMARLHEGLMVVVSSHRWGSDFNLLPELAVISPGGGGGGINKNDGHTSFLGGGG